MSIREKTLLVFQSAYTFEQITKMELQQFLKSRDISNFFDEVYFINPLASLQYFPDSKVNYSQPKKYSLSERESMVEGGISKYRMPKFLLGLNFLFSQISFVKYLARIGCLRHVSVVRSEDALYNGIAAWLTSRILNKPMVVAIGGNSNRIRRLTKQPLMKRFFRFSFFERFVETRILNLADLVIVLNQDNYEFVVELGITPSKIYRSNLGIEVHPDYLVVPRLETRLLELKENLLHGKEFLLTCVSRLEDLKHVDHVLYVANEIKNSGLSFKLLIVGDGSKKQDLIDLTETLGIESSVVFLGNQSQSRLIDLFCVSDLNIVPLGGRALLEASLCGCPSVAYDVDWHSEIILNGISGLLVPNLDINGLSEAVLHALMNDDLRTIFGRNSYQHARQFLNLNQITAEQRAMYSNLGDS
jgi:glycosyltransferase involved in cell wall biosynthesis